MKPVLVTDIYLLETRDAVKHPTVPSTDPHTKGAAAKGGILSLKSISGLYTRLVLSLSEELLPWWGLFCSTMSWSLHQRQPLSALRSTCTLQWSGPSALHLRGQFCLLLFAVSLLMRPDKVSRMDLDLMC